jgi:hypothetical protein
MSWDSIKSLIGSVAPTIAAALCGPLAGTATKFLSEKLLGKPDGTKEELTAALAGATPAQLMQLKDLEQQFALEMRKLDVDVFNTEVKDVQSARDMAKMDIRPHVIFSAMFFLGYFSLTFYLVYLFAKGADATSTDEFLKGMVATVVGVLTANIPTLVGFWFGSSMGSKNAGHTISQKLLNQ